MRLLLIPFTCCLLGSCADHRQSDATAQGGALTDAGADDDDAATATQPRLRPDTPSTDADATDTQLNWIVGLLNGPADAITPAEVGPHCDAAFLAAVPAAALAETLRQLGAEIAPVSVQSSKTEPEGGRIAILNARDGVLLRLSLAVEPARGKLIGLLFEPAPELDPTLATLPAIGERLGALAPHASLLVATPDGGKCNPLYERDADEARPLGSLFKIYVLGAVADRIARGEAKWSDKLAIHDEWKSLPSGELQDAKAGTELPLSSYADKMISISDNTAADHLLHWAGREAVEAEQSALGHSRPELNKPFLSTRELFYMRLVLEPEGRKAYLAASEAEKRALLDDDYATAGVPVDIEERARLWTEPRDIDSLEWFASAADICRAFSALKDQGQSATGQRALQALSLNPGLPVDRATFKFIGFKGGSEPGVLTGSWLLQRKADDAWRVVTLLSSDPAKPLQEIQLLYLAQAAILRAGD